MSTTNGAPRHYMNGIKDNSQRAEVLSTEQMGSMIPHILGFAERGGMDPIHLNASGIAKRHGSKTLDPTSDYGTHTTVLAEAIARGGASMVFQRLKPSDAETATLTLSLEIVGDTWDTPQRDANGRIVYDASGNPVPIETSVQTTAGLKLRWLVGTLSGELGARVNAAGDLSGTGGASTVYPILDLPVSSFGKYGDNIGLSMWAPIADGGSDSLNGDLVDEQQAMLYRLQLVERNPATGSKNIIQTINGANSIDFATKETFVDPLSNVSYAFEDRVHPSYDGSDEAVPFDAPFEEGHFYRDNWYAIATQIFSTEATPSLLDTVDMVNLLSCKATDGAEYHSARVVGTANQGVNMTRSAVHYASGGSDGTMTNSTLDALAAEVFANYTTGEYKLHDIARYPMNYYIDSGFSTETTKAMGAILGHRPDVILMASPQDASRPLNTPEEDSSIGLSIANAFRLNPESDLYGTGTCRAFVCKGAGNWKETGYKGVLPMVIQLAERFASFAGGYEFANEASFDSGRSKRLSGWKNHNIVYQSDTIQDDDWAAGLITPAWIDRKTLYFPAVQTVYTSDRSVLNNPFFVLIASVVTRESAAAHRELVGNASLTAPQYASEMMRLISEACSPARFADKGTVTPTTYYTNIDAANGNSSTTDIEISSPMMMKANTFTLLASRLEA